MTTELVSFEKKAVLLSITSVTRLNVSYHILIVIYSVYFNSDLGLEDIVHSTHISLTVLEESCSTVLLLIGNIIFVDDIDDKRAPSIILPIIIVITIVVIKLYKTLYSMHRFPV